MGGSNATDKRTVRTALPGSAGGRGSDGGQRGGASRPLVLQPPAGPTALGIRVEAEGWVDLARGMC